MVKCSISGVNKLWLDRCSGSVWCSDHFNDQLDDDDDISHRLRLARTHLAEMVGDRGYA
jgi:hypothetical protein